MPSPSNVESSTEQISQMLYYVPTLDLEYYIHDLLILLPINMVDHEITSFLFDHEKWVFDDAKQDFLRKCDKFESVACKLEGKKSFILSQNDITNISCFRNSKEFWNFVKIILKATSWETKSKTKSHKPLVLEDKFSKKIKILQAELNIKEQTIKTLKQKIESMCVFKWKTVWIFQWILFFKRQNF